MVLNGLAGLVFGEDALVVRPVRTRRVHELTLTGLRWRGQTLRLEIRDFDATATVRAEGDAQGVRTIRL